MPVFFMGASNCRRQQSLLTVPLSPTVSCLHQEGENQEEVQEKDKPGPGASARGAQSDGQSTCRLTDTYTYTNVQARVHAHAHINSHYQYTPTFRGVQTDLVYVLLARVHAQIITSDACDGCARGARGLQLRLKIDRNLKLCVLVRVQCGVYDSFRDTSGRDTGDTPWP